MHPKVTETEQEHVQTAAGSEGLASWVQHLCHVKVAALHASHHAAF